MKPDNWLQKLQPGDEVIVAHYGAEMFVDPLHRREPAWVEKITENYIGVRAEAPTRFAMFRRADGHDYLGGYGIIEPMTPEFWIAWSERELRTDAQLRVQKIMSATGMLRAITTEEWEQVEAILMGVAARIEAQRIAVTPKKKRRKEK